MKQNQLEDKLQPLTGERQKGESDSAVQACNDWLRLGPGRSLVVLVNDYQQKSTFSANYSPPTVRISTIRTWSSRYSWAERASAYDSETEARKKAYADAIMEKALASRYGRIEKLLKLADFLESQIYEAGQDEDGVSTGFHNVWTPDVKQIGGGEFAERVDIVRFNSALVSEYRATLDDIAKEVGERVKKSSAEVTGPDGGPIIFKSGMSLDDL